MARVPQDATKDVKVAVQDINDEITALRKQLANAPSDDTQHTIEELQQRLRKLETRPNFLDYNDVFRAAGPAHAIGYVPDPGVTTGTSKFLREDATWVAVSGSGNIDGGHPSEVYGGTTAIDCGGI
jgi:hypothetical protein